MSKQRISHYEIEKTLGEGAMGRVFLARDVNLDRMVALKMVHGALGDKGFHDRFRREARLAASLNHPHIATIYEFGEAEGESYLAMELVEGETLQERLRHGPLSPPEVRRLGAQAASALAAAHARGIVHRDIKPANLMITTSGDIKVMDFGVARRSGDTALTMDGALVGTANIMAPETIEGAEPTPASDLFSLGCVLYEALSGRPAFPGQSIVTVLHQVMNRDAQPLAELAPEVPADLVDLIHGLLRKDPAQRFGPAEAVARALTEKTGTAGEGGDAGTMVLPQAGGASSAGGTMVMPGGAPAPADRKPLWKRRRVWIPVAAVVLAFFIVVGIQQERQEASGGVDRDRAETLNAAGMEKFESYTNQIGRKDATLAEEARTYFQDAIAADTTYAVPHNNLGRLLARAFGDRSGAGGEYGTAIALDPEYAPAYLNMAAWLESENRPEEVVAYYRAAMRYDESESKSVMKTAANNLGYFYLSALAQPDSAAAVLQPMVVRFPDDPLLSKNYGLALLAEGRTDEAEKALDWAAEKGGARLPQVVAGLAAVAEARGDSAAAKDRWADLVGLVGPEDANMWRRTTLGITGVGSGAAPD